MTSEMLTARRLNRAILARQHLLERSNLPMSQVIEDMGGIQTQYAPSGYLALWSRMTDFERGALTRAKEEHDVITGSLMRVTIHTVTARDYWPIVAGIRRSRQAWLERVVRGQFGEVDFEVAATALREILQPGPMRARDLTVEMTSRGLPRQAVGWGSMWVELVRIPPSGTWERRANDLFDLAERWLPSGANGRTTTEEDGVRLLLTRYLSAFGPARLADFASWAGLVPGLAHQAAESMELIQFRDESGRHLVDLPDAPLPAEETPAPVRFLPVWDATLLVHCRRGLILPEEYRPRVFNTRAPHSVNTFLVDGQVAGTWRHEHGQVTTESFESLRPEAERDVNAEAAALEKFHAG